MRGFVNLLIVLLLFVPLTLTTIQLSRESREDYSTKIVAERLAYYYDDIVWDLEKIVGINSTYYKMDSSNTFKITIEDQYRVSDYRAELSTYKSQIDSYLSFLGIGNSFSLNSLLNYNDYSDLYLATKSGALNSYYRRYVSPSGNASQIVIYYDDVGKPTGYEFSIYIKNKLPFVSDSFTSISNSSNGVPVIIKMCYPYLAQTQCRTYSAKLNPSGSATYTAKFYIDTCNKDLNLTVNIGGASLQYDEVSIYVPPDVVAATNVTINGSTNTSNYKFTQLFFGQRGSDKSYLVLWQGDVIKGDYNKIVVDEG